MQRDAYLLNNIAQFRHRFKMTQTDLARAAGTSKNTISCLETYQFYPSAFLAFRICEVFGCTFEELFYFNPKVNYQQFIQQKIEV